MQTYTNIITVMWPFVLLVVLFYFFIFLPKKRRRARFATMLAQLTPGKQVVTKCGTLGTIESLKEDTIIITLHGGTTSEIIKEAVMYVRAENKTQ